jgi:hypothetical protein
MRSVVLQMGVTVDGYVARADDDGASELPPEHWPQATGDYADFMNSLPKVGFSATLPAAQNRRPGRKSRAAPSALPPIF